MIVGENPRSEDLPVNPTKAKHVTNHRAAGSDKSEALTPRLNSPWSGRSSMSALMNWLK